MCSKLHYISVGPGGTFNPTGPHSTSQADIDNIFNAISESGKNKLIVYIHGGLVNAADGLERAERVRRYFEDIAYPLTFVWETGLAETVRDNLSTIARSEFYWKVIKYSIRHAARFILNEPLGMAQIDSYLKNNQLFEYVDDRAQGLNISEDGLNEIDSRVSKDVSEELERDKEIDDIIKREIPALPLLNVSFAKEVATEVARGIAGVTTTKARIALSVARITYRVIRRFKEHRDHKFYPTTVEETLREFYLDDAGAWVWDGMKNKAATMWQPNDGLNGNDRHPGRYFLEKLASYQNAFNRTPLTVDFVGHSAGSIVIGNMISEVDEYFSNAHPRRARQQQIISLKNILFLAPACTSDFFFNNVIGKQNCFNDFRMFTMKDKLETSDHMVPGLYNSSLLYFISGVLEHDDGGDHPIAGLVRHSTGQRPYDFGRLGEVSNYLRQPNRMVLSKAIGQPAGLNSTARTHGGFGDDLPTIQSIREVVA